MTQVKRDLSRDLAAEIGKLAKQKSEQDGITYAQAYAKVLEVNPELYSQHEHVRQLEDYLAKP